MNGGGTFPDTKTVGSSGWQGLARDAARGYLTDTSQPIAPLRELLVFGLDGSAYAVPVERVREIVRMRDLTRVPRAPAWLLGVVALRGEVVEVVDLRRRLGLGESSPDRSSRIIVLHGDDDRVTGLLVDSVSEVHRVAKEAIMPAQGLDAGAVSEVCLRGEEFVSILDVDRVLGASDG
jgi:purine-binding chemotaxis protein CheW